MFALTAITIGALTIHGGTTCPAADEVVAAIEASAGLRELELKSMDIEIADAERDVVLRLREGGKSLATKTIPRGDSSCAELARAAAVVITSWQLRSDEWTPYLPRLGRADARGVVNQSRTPRPSVLQYELSAAFLSSIASTGAFAPGAEATASFTRRGKRWLGRLSMFGTDLRQRQLGFGTMAWTRVALAAGVAYRLGSIWQVDLHADAVAALLVLRGSGAATSTAFDLDPGLGGGVRGNRRWTHVAAFIDAGVVGWLRSQQVNATGSSDTVEVPRLDVLLTVGLSYGN
jgi:hypothetical protein